MLTPTETFESRFRKPRDGRTLIVGSRVYSTREDRRKLYRDAVGVDMLDGPGVDVVCNLEDLHLCDEDALNLLEPGLFQHVECRSVLEHSRRPWLLASNLERMMAPGATLDLTVPFVWRPHFYPGDFWRFTTEGIRELFPAIEWKSLMYATQEDLWDGDRKMPKQMVGGSVHFPRTEVLGWGMKRC